jgi:hypothetical protein
VEINFLSVLSGDITLSISTSELLKTSLLDLLIILLGLVGVLKALVNLLPVLVGLKGVSGTGLSGVAMIMRQNDVSMATPSKGGLLGVSSLRKLYSDL